VERYLAATALHLAVDQAWLAVGELVLTVCEDRPREAELAVVDDLAEQALELQADVAVARELLACLSSDAGVAVTHLPMVSARLASATTRYWQRLRSHAPVAELRRAARHRRGELPAWQLSVEAGAQRCEAPLAACADALHQCWSELCRSAEAPLPVTASDPRRSP
jgi:hypothetical protein